MNYRIVSQLAGGTMVILLQFLHLLLFAILLFTISTQNKKWNAKANLSLFQLKLCCIFLRYCLHFMFLTSKAKKCGRNSERTNAWFQSALPTSWARCLKMKRAERSWSIGAEIRFEIDRSLQSNVNNSLGPEWFELDTVGIKIPNMLSKVRIWITGILIAGNWVFSFCMSGILMVVWLWNTIRKVVQYT